MAPSKTIPANRCRCGRSDGLRCKRDCNVIPVCKDPVVATVWMGREISAATVEAYISISKASATLQHDL
jgi:hypothetical protein